MSGHHEFEGADEARERVRRQVAAAYEQGTEPPPRRCPTCGVESATWLSRCPSCDKRYDRRWPWLTDRARWALAGLAVVALIAVVAYASPRVSESTRAQAERAAREQAERVERNRVRMTAEQQPQFANGSTREDLEAPAADRLAARRALVAELQTEILADARSRIESDRMDGPVRQVLCDPLIRAPSKGRDEDDLRKRRGRYDCVAVKRDVVRTGKLLGYFGHPFVGTIEFRTGRLTWCRDTKIPGESGKPLVKVALDPRCVGAENADRLGDGFITPKE